MRSAVGRAVVRAYSTQSSGPIVSSTLLLSRNPVITAELQPFENQYYKYQNELWRRLMWTFPKWFYFREGTASEQRFRQLNKNPVANNPDIEFPRGRPELRHSRDRRFKQELRLPKTYKEEVETGEGLESEASAAPAQDDLARKIVPNSRTTKADENDQTSLERRLARTLYLVIKSNDKWTLPNFVEESAEELKALHVLAEEGLYKIGGEQINYFNVSNTPCHVYNNSNENKKEYIIKSHILSGEFKPQDESLQFLWLTKEELEKHLDRAYYTDIAHLLSSV
ncbi:60S ribosomal protein L17, mitochondrial precursor [Scheffersomyces xylosifermentans]|uniref:60S ribosomal protein L17, mitochondrial precursor n=1 Tax=Scheffersomyces xylosifermentans TaxID=1304137 RepID=UPI00315D16EC